MSKFDDWHYAGRQLFEGEIKNYMYDFLFKFETLLDKETLRIKNNLFKKLDYIQETNLKKIDSCYDTNIHPLINEIKDAIILDNFWSIFCCIELLAERVVDLIIKKESSKLEDTSEFPNLKDRISKGLSLGHKIKLLNILYNNYNTLDLEILISIMKLIQRMRNKFMFHIKNYDDFRFIFKEDISEKEDLLRELFVSIKNEIDDLLKLLGETNIDRNILEYYSKSFEKYINFYRSREWGGNATVNNFSTYEALPTFFAKIACFFLMFFGKEDLNLFDKDK